MDGIQQAAQIAANFRRDQKFQAQGQLWTAVAAVAASIIPICGGTVAYAIDKAGAHFFEAPVKQGLVDLCDAVTTLEPTLNKVANLDQAVSQIYAILGQHDDLIARLTELMKALAANANAPMSEYTSVVGNYIRATSLRVRGRVVRVQDNHIVGGGIIIG